MENCVLIISAPAVEGKVLVDIILDTVETQNIHTYATRTPAHVGSFNLKHDSVFEWPFSCPSDRLFSFLLVPLEQIGSISWWQGGRELAGISL